MNAVLNGFIEAQQNYENWSGGFWLWQAPEYLISTTVAKCIFALDGAKYITLEHGSTTTLEDAGAKGIGRLPKDIREKGKVDILLWWGNNTPRATIEIKNQIYSTGQYEKDIKRIGRFLQRNSQESSLQFGAFAFYESATSGPRKTAREKVNDRIKNIFQKSKRLLGNEYDVTINTSEIYEEFKNNAWSAACILIKLKKK
jgi:hypothetical protein